MYNKYFKTSKDYKSTSAISAYTTLRHYKRLRQNRKSFKCLCRTSEKYRPSRVVKSYLSEIHQLFYKVYHGNIHRLNTGLNHYTVNSTFRYLFSSFPPLLNQAIKSPSANLCNKPFRQTFISKQTNYCNTALCFSNTKTVWKKLGN